MTDQPKSHSFLRMILATAASFVSCTATHPLDTIKIRLQKEGEVPDKQKKYRNLFRGLYTVTREEGFRALYKGLIMALFREATYSTFRLGLYEPYKNLLGEKPGKPSSFAKKFLAGLLSGCTGAIIANPFDLLKVRLQSLNTKKSIKSEILQIFHRDGIKGYYKGGLPSITRGAITNGTKMASYDQTKQILKSRFNFQEGLSLHSMSAFIAGFIITITTSPMDLVKTRIMSQEAGKKVYKGMFDCVVTTFRKEGPGAFYKGFLTQWMRIVPFNIIQLMVWEQLRNLFGIRNV